MFTSSSGIYGLIVRKDCSIKICFRKFQKIQGLPLPPPRGFFDEKQAECAQGACSAPFKGNSPSAATTCITRDKNFPSFLGFPSFNSKKVIITHRICLKSQWYFYFHFEKKKRIWYSAHAEVNARGQRELNPLKVLKCSENLLCDFQDEWCCEETRLFLSLPWQQMSEISSRNWLYSI